MSGRARSGDAIYGFLRRLHLAHSGSTLKFERDAVQLAPKCEREKLVSGFNDPWCTCRNDNQTVRHILQDCPLYHNLSQSTIYNLGGEKERARGGAGYRVEEHAVTPAFRSESGAAHVENRSPWAV